MFAKEAFVASFDGRLHALASAEKITKDTLRDLSRDLLFITQETEDIGYINRTIDVLTPMNRKVAILFFKEFSGFVWNEDEVKFVKKNKKLYDAVKGAAIKRLEDPHFNVWTWADANIDMEKKKFTVSEVTEFAKKAIKKAEKEGITQADLIGAFFAAGFEVDALVAAMDKLTQPQE